MKKIKLYAAISVLVGGISLSTCAQSNDAKIYEEFSNSIDFDYERSLEIPDIIEKIGERVKEQEMCEIQKKVKRLAFDEYVGNTHLLDKESFQNIQDVFITWDMGRKCFEVSAKNDQDNYVLRFDKSHVSLISYMIDQINCQNVYLDSIDDQSIYDTLAECANLKGLLITNSQIRDISFLSNLTNLERLTIENCPNVSDLTSIEPLTSLIYLTINGTSVSDVEALANLTNLKQANLRGNKIVNPNALSTLTNLETLYLEYNEIDNILCLNNLQNLANLEDNVLNNVIKSSSEESIIFEGKDYINRTKNILVTYYDAKEQYFVELIDADNSLCAYSMIKSPYNIYHITDGLENCTGIRFINCKDTAIISWIADAQKYETLVIDHCQFDNLYFLDDFKNLTYLGIDDCPLRGQFSTIPTLPNLEKIKTLSFKNTNVQNVDSLSDNKNIEQIELSYNDITNFDFLTTLPNLQLVIITVDDGNHPVETIRTLIDRGITVKVNDVVVNENNFDSIYKFVEKRYTK